jgi:formylglycine-generating enzyme required for sulfatase activity
MTNELDTVNGTRESLSSEFTFDVVTVDERGTITGHRQQSATQYIVSLSETVALHLVLIPGGEYLMGSQASIGFEDEYPQHSVNVSSFLMGKYPVTQVQWAAVMDWKPPYRFKGTNKPVDRISWNDASTFCRRFTEQVGVCIRLPSESEWEYACRAGTMTPFCFGETITTELANYNGEHLYRSEPKGGYRHQTMEVGSFPPNSFGLYDMHGTVWEWCADAWHNSYMSAPVDGSVWEDAAGSARVLRGGCWHDPPNLSRSAARLRQMPYESEDFFGFRVVLSEL